MPEPRHNRRIGNRRERERDRDFGPSPLVGLTPEEAEAAGRAMERIRDAFGEGARRIGLSLRAAIDTLSDGMDNIGAAFRGTFLDADGNLLDSWREIARLIEENEPAEDGVQADSDTETFLREVAHQFRITPRSTHGTISVSTEMAEQLATRFEEIADRLAANLSTDDEPIGDQISRLANFITSNVPGEPSQNEGAIDCAIRLLQSSGAARPELCPDCNGQGGHDETDDDGNVIRSFCTRCDGRGFAPRDDPAMPPEHVNARATLANASSREELETLARQIGIDPPPPSDAGPIVTFSDIGHAIDRHLNGNPAATPHEVFLADDTLEETGGASLLAFDNPIDWAVYVVSYALDDGRRFPVVVTFEGVRAVYQFGNDEPGGHELIVEVALCGPAEDDIRRPQFRLSALQRDGRQFRGRAWRVTLLGEHDRIDVDDFERASMGRTWGALAETVRNGARLAQDAQVLTGPRHDWARHLRGPMIEMVEIWRPDFVAYLGMTIRRLADRPTRFSVSVQLAPALITDGSGPRDQSARRFFFTMTAPTRRRPEWGIEYAGHPTAPLFSANSPADRARAARANARANTQANGTTPADDQNPPANVEVERPRLAPLDITATVRTEMAAPGPSRYERRQSGPRLCGLARSEQRFGDAVRQAIAENVDREGAGDSPVGLLAQVEEGAREVAEFQNAGAAVEGHATTHACGGTDPVDRVAEDVEVQRRAETLDGPVTMTRPGVTIREIDMTLHDPIAPGALAGFVAPAGTDRGALGVPGPGGQGVISRVGDDPEEGRRRRAAIEEWARSVRLGNIQAADGPDDPRVYVEAVRDVGSAGIFFAPSRARVHHLPERNVTEIEGQIVGGLVARPASIEFSYDPELNRFEVKLSIRSLRWRDGNLDIEFAARQSRGAVSIEPGERFAPLALREAIRNMMVDVADESYRQESGGHDPVAAAEIAARCFLGEQMAGDNATPVRALDRYNLIPQRLGEATVYPETRSVIHGRIDTPRGSAGFYSSSIVSTDPDGDEHLIVEFHVEQSGIRWTENVYRRDASDPRGIRTLLLRAAYNLGRRLDGLLDARRRRDQVEPETNWSNR